jgi:hypothetical protein
VQNGRILWLQDWTQIVWKVFRGLASAESCQLSWALLRISFKTERISVANN